MFYGCSALTCLDLSGFDTGNVTTMQTMFYNCTHLEEISGLETFTTGSLYDSTGDTSNGAMEGMFQKCSALKSLDLRSFDTSGVKTMHDLFNGCSSLEGVLFGSGFVNANVTNLSYMFNDCSSLLTLELSGFDTFEVTNMNFMFRGCSNLESIIVTADPGSPGADPNGRWSVEKVTYSTGMFNGCVNLPNYTASKTDKERANTDAVYGYLTDK
ncbi:MAG: BspA family leucine-rich repeat surface protein [Clostridia bacterium]|nr:BspA family leucine-rich repeat surface protein [Clostridia bacterium]